MISHPCLNPDESVVKMMSNRILYTALAVLMLIGAFTLLFHNPLAVLFPLIVLGILAFFAWRPYRHQSSYWKSRARYSHYHSSKEATARKATPYPYANTVKPKAKRRKKNYPFRVIEGKKGKEPPQTPNEDKHLLH